MIIHTTATLWIVISLSVGELFGSIFLNTAIMGIADFVANAVLLVVMPHFQRQVLTSLNLSFSWNTALGSSFATNITSRMHLKMILLFPTFAAPSKKWISVDRFRACLVAFCGYCCRLIYRWNQHCFLHPRLLHKTLSWRHKRPMLTKFGALWKYCSWLFICHQYY